MGDIVLVRHGQTEWSLSGRHTSTTDVDLTAEGEQQARDLGPALTGRRFAAVLSSPMRRALHTARLADLEVTQVAEELREWDYGRYEGITTAQIRAQEPNWSLWRDGCPDGETPDQVGHRVDRLWDQVRPLLRGGSVALLGHGHCLRVIAARWIGLPVRGGAVLGLDTASISVLGHERQQPVIRRWNLVPGSSPPAT